MTNQASDEEAALPQSSRVLTSEGKKEAQAYVTAELHDSVRPTLEMDKVQITDPRRQITVKTARPAAARGPLPAPMPPPKLPRGLSSALDADLDDEVSERPTIPRDDGGEHPTIPMMSRTPVPAEPAHRGGGAVVFIAAVTLLALAGAWLALAPGRHVGSAAPGPPSATAAEPSDTTRSPSATAAPTVDTTPAPSATAAPTVETTPAPSAAPAAPAETTAPAAPAAASVPRPHAPRPTAAKPSASAPAAPPPTPAAPPPTPAAPPPAKGRLFSVEN